MPIRRVLAYENVLANRGKVAIERRPLVFCAEGVDRGGNALKLAIADSSELRPYFRKELLGRVTVIEGDGFLLDERGNKIKKQKIFLIPYFSWANRGKTEMAVWLLRKN